MGPVGDRTRRSGAADAIGLPLERPRRRISILLAELLVQVSQDILDILIEAPGT